MNSTTELDLPGARVAAIARDVRLFFSQYVAPLLFRRTRGNGGRRTQDIAYEEQFWGDELHTGLGAVRLNEFQITDWFPRAPGVYWSGNALRAREMVWSRPAQYDRQLGTYYAPESKLALVEQGGIGTVRLRPRTIDGTECWLATAVKGGQCHQGIPLAVPTSLLMSSGISWGDVATIEGRLRFLQDVGLQDTASQVHHARPLIVVAERVRGVASQQKRASGIVITPVTLFDALDRRSQQSRRASQYSFVQCLAGSDVELDAAAEWFDRYASKHGGRTITNFDEQRPTLADAPLSYQRLVANTYDRDLLRDLGSPVIIERVEQLFATAHIGDLHMGHQVNVNGPAIVAIDSTLTNVTQSVNAATSLNEQDKDRLEELVRTIRKELDAVKSERSEDAAEIAAALDKAVTTATKPKAERKRNFLELSAKGLRDAAALVKDTAPGILATADLIAKFIVGL